MRHPHASDGTGRRGYHHGNLREALLDAARDLVAERGPQGFTLVEAARRAGVSASAPYRHFRDREDVLAALRERGFRLFGTRLEVAVAGADGPGERLARLGPAYLAFAREEPGHYAAMFSFRPPGDAPAHAPPAGSPFTALLQVIAGTLPPDGPDPRLVALQVWALSHGLAMLERAGLPPPGSGAPPAEMVLATGVESLLRRRRAPP